ncbi:MAG TPA: hypothetical protein VLU24_01150 [Mycobacterium sp.]|nr:hypothetical protein [Mycobacterium sp.]
MSTSTPTTSRARRWGFIGLGLLLAAMVVAGMLPAIAMADPAHLPVTTAVASPGTSAPGAITVTLTANANGGPGVASTHWGLWPADDRDYDPVGRIVLSDQGVYDLWYWSVDVDGDAETPQYMRLHVGNGSWTWQASGPASYGGIAFANRNSGWAVGWNGAPVIVATTNGGTTWAAQSPGAYTDAQLFSVCGKSALRAWTVGYNNATLRALILRTTNGGTNWTSQLSGVNDQLYGVSFADLTHGWAVGYKVLPAPSGPAILATTNGGTVWTAQGAGVLADGWFNAVSATDINHAWAVGFDDQGFPAIVATANAGALWTRQDAGVTHSGVLNAVSFLVDGLHGWAVGNDWETSAPIIVATTDGGAHWSTQDPGLLPGARAQLNGVSFTDALHGWAVGYDDDDFVSLVLHTVDGGLTWTSQDTGSDTFLRCSSFPDLTHGWTAGDNGFIATTSTGGMDAGYTPVGAPSSVDLGSGVVVTFDTVTAEGITQTSTTPVDPGDMIGGFTVISDDYRTFQTSATCSGSVQITMPYDPGGMTSSQQEALRVFCDASGTWANVATSVDTDNHLITCSVGNLSGRFAIGADLTLPVTGTSGYPGGWQRVAVTLGLLPTDDLGSGIQTTQYSLDGGVTWTAGTSIVFPVWKRGGGDGHHPVRYRSIDVAGNTESTRNVDVMIDHQAPSATSDAPKTPVVGPQTIHVHPSDATSGVAATSWKLDAGGWTNQADSADVSIPVAGVGTHWIYCYVTDVAGNVGTLKLFCVKITTSGMSKAVRPPTRADRPKTAPPPLRLKQR